MGRPKKPLALLKNDDTFRADRHGDAVDVPPGDPAIPVWLSEDGRAHWQDYVRLFESMKVLTELDGPALALLCETTAEWLACLAAGREAGRVLLEERGQSVRVSAHPMTVQAKLLGAELHKMLSAFGLNPSARRNVAVTKAEGEAPAKDDFFSKKGRKAK